MNAHPFHRMLLVTFALLAGLPVAAEAQQSPKKQLTVAGYVQMTVQWHQLTQDCWLKKNRPPTIEEQLALCKTHEVTLREYLTYPAKHTKEIDAYLADHPDVQEQIKKLTARIKEIIQSQDKNK